MDNSPSLSVEEKNHWWLSNKKMVDKYMKDVGVLLSSQEKTKIATAIILLDAALALSPQLETALELKARSLLYLGRFKEVVDMLQEHLPSFKMVLEESSLSSNNTSHQLSRERIKKEKWRYLVLGEACYYLGLMEDSMILLQTGKRLSTEVLRRKSIYRSNDTFSFSKVATFCNINTTNPPTAPPPPEAEKVTQLIRCIKPFLHRRTAALAALDAGLYSETIHQFSKILNNHRKTPQLFLEECYMHRASAYRAVGQIADSIADCNRVLAINPTCIPALIMRADLFETIQCLPNCLDDLEHLRLLYNSILHDGKLPWPSWKRHNVRYHDIPGNVCALGSKIENLRRRVASWNKDNVDYYALIGLRRGCSRLELEREHLLLRLRHRLDNATDFVDRCEFVDDSDLDSVKNDACKSASMLHRLMRKGYSRVTSTIIDEEVAEKQKGAAIVGSPDLKMGKIGVGEKISSMVMVRTMVASVFEGVLCRDIGVIGNSISQLTQWWSGGGNAGLPNSKISQN